MPEQKAKKPKTDSPVPELKTLGDVSDAVNKLLQDLPSHILDEDEDKQQDKKKQKGEDYDKEKQKKKLTPVEQVRKELKNLISTLTFVI